MNTRRNSERGERKKLKTDVPEGFSKKTKRFSRFPLAIEKIFDTIEYTFEVQDTKDRAL
jgi:hypothetical protein